MNFLEAMSKIQMGSGKVRPKGRWYGGYEYVVDLGMMDRPQLFRYSEGGAAITQDYVPTFYDFRAEWEVVY
jgi:hypothetical protein